MPSRCDRFGYRHKGEIVTRKQEPPATPEQRSSEGKSETRTPAWLIEPRPECVHLIGAQLAEARFAVHRLSSLRQAVGLAMRGLVAADTVVFCSGGLLDDRVAQHDCELLATLLPQVPIHIYLSSS